MGSLRALWVLSISVFATGAVLAHAVETKLVIEIQSESTYRVEGDRLVGLETRMTTRTSATRDAQELAAALEQANATILPSHDTLEILASGKARLQDDSDEFAPIDAELTVAELQRSSAAGSEGVISRLVVAGADFRAIYAGKFEEYTADLREILQRATGQVVTAQPETNVSDAVCSTDLAARIMTCTQSVRFTLAHASE